jgi:hypothetical protein
VDKAGSDHGLYGNTGGFILLQNSVEDSIANLVTDLVWVTFGYGF